MSIPHIHQIEPQLFLGNVLAASDLATYGEHRLTHVLTIASFPLCPVFVAHLPASVRVKYVQLSDTPSADLFGRLHECLDFVSAAIDPNTSNRCLVHCQMGVSRSASIVIAYLMRKYRLDYETICKRVQSVRPNVGPNSGFVQQLRLFHQLDFCTDEESCTNNSAYKIYRLRFGLAEAEDEFHYHPILTMQMAPNPPAEPEPQSVLYRCRCCRGALATGRDHIQHARRTAMPLSLVNRYLGLLNDIFATGAIERRLEANGLCTETILVRPIEWMRAGVTDNMNGPLLCPKCSAKVGRYDWAERTRCVCGMLIGPAFHLVPSKVDICRAMKK